MSDPDLEVKVGPDEPTAWHNMGCGTVLVVLILCITAYEIAKLWLS